MALPCSLRIGKFRRGHQGRGSITGQCIRPDCYPHLHCSVADSYKMLFLGILCLAVGTLGHPTLFVPQANLESGLYYPSLAIVKADEKPVPGIPEAPKLVPLPLVKALTVEELKEDDLKPELVELVEEKLEEENNGVEVGEWKLEEENDGDEVAEEKLEEESDGDEVVEEKLEEENDGDEVEEEKLEDENEGVEVIEENFEEDKEQNEEEVKDEVVETDKEGEFEIEKHAKEEKPEVPKKPVVVKLEVPNIPEFITNWWTNRPFTSPHISLPQINFPFSLPNIFSKPPPTSVPAIETARYRISYDLPTYYIDTPRYRIIAKK
ncbi:hypothetical protein evm_009024 [Chilo suppressalis]|nr:hypothetical protein evm_009024 [Chilo suppressalis]